MMKEHDNRESFSGLSADKFNQAAEPGNELEILRRENAILLQNLQEYRSYVDNLNATIVVMNPDGIITYVSPNWTNLLGHELNEVVGKSAYEAFIHPDDVPENKDYMADTLAKGIKNNEIEYRIRHKDGSWRWHSTHGSPILDENGKVVSFLAIARDITEKKLTSEALQRSEEKYRLLYENIIVGVIQHKFDLTYTTVNKSLVRMFGYDSPDEMKANVNEQLCVNPKELERFMQLLLEQGHAENVEMELRKKNGETFWALINARLERDEQGNPYWLESTSIDISEHKQAEMEKFKLLSIIDNSFNEIFIFDAQTMHYEYMNQSAMKNSGYTLEEMRLMTPRDFTATYDEIAAERMINDLLNEIKPVQLFEAVQIRKDGSTYNSEVQIQLHRQAGGNKFYAVVNDITESKSLKEQIVATQKLEAIGILAGGIAHDFNNLLTIILGYAEELIEEVGENSLLKMEAEEIVKAGKRASSLTKQLLSFSRKQVVQPQLLDVNDTITNLQKMLYRLVGDEVEIETDLTDDLGIIKADPGQIEQIIVNMALNAKDAMPEGGEFRLETSNLLVGQNYIRNNVNVNPGIYVALAIKDNGKGMSKETKDRLFEPFFTTKETGQALGLGLSTVYGIVKQFEGYILVDSEIGKGTCFTVLIPAREAKLHVAKDTPNNNDLMGKQEHLLIVEDDKALLHFLSKLISNLGYKVTAKFSSVEALGLIEQGLRPDLVLSDVVMPMLNGKEMCDRIKKIVPTQKVLFMSGYTGDALLNRGILEQGIPFINKPFNSLDIAKHIHDILNEAATKKKTGIEILMLDDEESIRILLQRACQKKGHHLTGCGTLEEALQVLSAKTFDMLLLDMHLSGINGIQALKKIRDGGFKIPVIVLTGAINPADADALACMGAIKTLEKSFDNQPLLNFIEAYMVKN
ncbi:MAG: PAS domain S-box protein [Candidatus Cloacimonas sp.]|jgi:PAS domain S-box-containing protein|nr:PAS domain S-box protein [Candidatus Cloacimonas sp.]